MKIPRVLSQLVFAGCLFLLAVIYLLVLTKHEGSSLKVFDLLFVTIFVGVLIYLLFVTKYEKGR
jgi:hypothetical protein